MSVKSVFRATTQDDEPGLIAFLSSAFGTARDAPFLRAPFMQWKYWMPREDYTEPRSYVLERDGKIVAHAGLWPVTLRTPAETSRGVHMMDWASDPAAPGSGVAIVQRLLTMFDFIYAIGGTEMTRKVLPAFGFQTVMEAWIGARPLRPFRQLLAHQSVNWKLPARFVRNLVWSKTPRRASTRGWSVASADLNGVEAPAVDTGRAWRPNAFFRYLENCPVAKVRVYDLQRDRLAAGRVALSLCSEQARVLGVWLNQASDDALRVAYTLAQNAAQPALEITVSGSTAESRQAAVAAGFRILQHAPVYLIRRKGNLPALPFEFQMADSNDAGFLAGDRPEFMT